VKARTLTVSLTYGDGPIGRPPRLKLSLYFSGTGLGDAAQAGGTLARDGAGFLEFSLGAAPFGELCRAAEEAGFPGRAPKVEGKNDTSDRWAHAILTVSLDGRAQMLDLSLLSSGFGGADAPALHCFFGLLLAAAGIRDESILFDLAGS